MPDWNHSFTTFIEYLYRYGLEFFRRYHGPYKALVINNHDPEGLGRIIVECPRARLGPGNTSWVLPMMQGAGSAQGIFWPPEEKEYVWVFFENGDPTIPLAYMGGWYAAEDVPDGDKDNSLDPEDDGAPKKRGFQTPGGHSVVLDDKGGEEKITIRHKNGTIIQWTEGNKVKLGKEDGSFEPLVRGNAWKQWAENHTHPHSWGPTSKPIQPIPSDVLSDDTETS